MELIEFTDLPPRLQGIVFARPDAALFLARKIEGFISASGQNWSDSSYNLPAPQLVAQCKRLSRIPNGKWLALHLLISIAMHSKNYYFEGLDEAALAIALELWTTTTREKSSWNVYRFIDDIYSFSEAEDYQSDDYADFFTWDQDARGYFGRTRQFLVETQRIVTTKVMVLRTVGHHLPAELVDNIHGCLLDLHHLPRPTQLHEIWAPKPELAQCSKTVGCTMSCDLTCPAKVRLKWTEMERRFVYYHGYNPRPCRFQPCESHHPPPMDGEYDDETFHPTLLGALELAFD
ncbi:hypothetical protein AOQ84DRAFT_352552 [Glonium stellatum]|uniref:Uncharacterized protein n=1 Tax=Glonium stellatum TaxID=574774 RepID=A0A8E2JX48_9PEZI|nr:hypothetical protein AOQ84DRAFT_352552 [Glonium stellatum]